MIPKSIRNATSSMSHYSSYVLVLFCWNLVTNVFESLNVRFLGLPSTVWVLAGGLFLVGPILAAGVVGGINDFQSGAREWGVSRFSPNVRKYFFRLLGASLICVVPALILGGLVGVVLNLAELGPPQMLAKWSFAATGYASRLIIYFWYVGLVVEGGKFWRGLQRGVRLLAGNGWTLAIAGTWCIVGIMEPDCVKAMGEEAALVSVGIRAAIRAFGAVFVYAVLVAHYRSARAERYGEFCEEAPAAEPPPLPVDQQRVSPGLWVSFLSFIPPFNFVALILGWRGLKRNPRFAMRALIACCLGGFFTAVYGLTLVGAFLPRGASREAVGYDFLLDADPALHESVAYLEEGAFFEAPASLDQWEAEAKEKDSWPAHCAVGIVKYMLRDTHAAVAAFERAEEKEPDRAEFFYYYGLALLDDANFVEPPAVQGRRSRAAKNFQRTLELDPALEDAARMNALIVHAYDPSQTENVIWVITILLFLFTTHEFAHAYAAWKLGDDTAKSQGRVTLNPLAHVDPVGSVLLPAILIWRESAVVFGWARPVPVNVENFANPRRDHRIVSFAGPAANLATAMFAFLSIIGVAFAIRVLWPEALSLNLCDPFSPTGLNGVPATAFLSSLFSFLSQLLLTSIVLGCFNLLPIPPLDGSHIFSSVLPAAAEPLIEKLRPFSVIAFFAIVFSPALDVLLSIPISIAWALLYCPLAALGFA